MYTPAKHEKRSSVLDFSSIARNVYSIEQRDSIKSSHSCEIAESESQLITLPDQQDTEPAMGSDIKSHFIKVTNAANSAAQIKQDILARQEAASSFLAQQRSNSKIYFIQQPLPQARRLSNNRTSSRIATEETQIEKKSGLIGSQLQSFDENIFTSECEIVPMDDDDIDIASAFSMNSKNLLKPPVVGQGLRVNTQSSESRRNQISRNIYEVNKI